MLNEILLRDECGPGASGDVESAADADVLCESRALEYLVALWSVRALRRRPSVFRSRNKFTFEDEVAGVTGLSGSLVGEQSEARVIEALKAREAELEAAPVTLSGPLFDNTATLSRLLALTDVETAVLLFSMVLHGNQAFESVLHDLGEVTKRDLVSLLAHVLRFPFDTVRRALRPEGTLASAGILWLERGMSAYISQRLALLEGLVDNLGVRATDPGRLFVQHFRAAPAAGLTRADFGHVAGDWHTIEALLRDALASGRQGVNVLLHGAPGVGKTELVRALGQTLDVTVQEIANDRERRDCERLRSYCLAQRILARRGPALILFDEVEDVFPASRETLFGPQRASGRAKSWTNELLETTPVPAVWVTNRVEAIDAAFLRRFDYVAELPTPPRAVRLALLEDQLDGLDVGRDWLKRVAGSDLAPSEIERAARLARLAAGDESGAPQAVFERAVRGMQRAMGSRWRLPPAANDGSEFDFSLVNSDVDLETATRGLKAAGAGRLALYGPPGTGKSLYARHLAARLDRTLVRKRASDLLSMWVGGTEQNIAAMFEQANDDNAVLLLDEADSFLRDRRFAQHEWEVTQVNELLTQMEDYGGVLVCATNLFEDLDPAVLRRFDLKIRLDWLCADQAWDLCVRTARLLGIPDEPETSLAPVRSRLQRLTNLAPGDFAAVARGSRLSGQADTWAGLAAMLEREAAMKPGGLRRKPGFIDR